MDDQEKKSISEDEQLPALEESTTESIDKTSSGPDCPNSFFKDPSKVGSYTNLLPRQITIDGPDNKMRYLRVVSFFADKLNDFTGLSIKHENGENERVEAWWAVDLLCDLWGSYPDPKYSGKLTGYNCIKDKVVMDIFSAAVLGYGGSIGVKKVYFCMDPGFGGIAQCAVEYVDPDWEQQIEKIIKSAESAIASTKLQSCQSKSDMAKRSEALNHFMKTYVQEQEKLYKTKPTKRAITHQK